MPKNNHHYCLYSNNLCISNTCSTLCPNRQGIWSYVVSMENNMSDQSEFDRDENDFIIWNEKSKAAYEKMTTKLIKQHPNGIHHETK